MSPVVDDAAPAGAAVTPPTAAAAEGRLGVPTGDEVDRLVEAWRRELPDLDVEPLHILSRLTRLARHLDLARRATFAELALEGWEFDVISALRRAGEPYELSPGALVAQTLSTSGTMTNRIDRLTDRALVERRPDPHDRRGVRVRLTRAGASRADEAITALVERERAFLVHLPPAKRTALTGLLADLLATFETGSR